MIYAPVLIPTLNRIEHLKRCITSLQANIWAKYTTLIISVDYPPEERYRDGYQKVCNYLKERIEGFADVIVILQEKNLGAYQNYLYLKEYVGKRFDRYIFTEDDNEMAPNFLEYIDKGLELFEKDKNIIAICSTGVEDEKESIEENIVLTHNFSAHGYGTWIKKEMLYAEEITRDYFNSISRNAGNLWRLYKYDPSLLFACQSVIFRKEKLYQLPDGGVPVIDMTVKIYAVLRSKYVVCPCLKKSRNWGYDGSGENCPNMDNLVFMTEIDTRRNFEYKYKNAIRISKNTKIYTPEIEIRAVAAALKMLSNFKRK